VRVAHFQVDELLTWELGLDGRSGGFDRGTETDTHETENGAVSFADTEDVVLEVCPGCTCTR
jgi:hypothetical protein